MKGIVILLFAGLFLRILFTYILGSHNFYHLDVQVYKEWAYLLHQWTFREMYSNAHPGWGAHLPLHYYILYLVGYIYKMFGFTPDSLGFLPDLIIKMHVFIPEVLTAYLIWLVVKKNQKQHIALLAASLFLFHPAIMYTSVMHAQPDAIIMFFALLALYLLLEKKPVLSTLAMASSLLLKPQALSLMPLYALASLQHFRFKQLLAAGLIGTIYIVFAFYPFTIGRSYPWVYEYIKKLADYYLFTSVYALNIWGYEGFMLSDMRTWAGLTLKKWGLCIVYSINALILGAIYLKRVKLSASVLFSLSIISFYTTYLFATRMGGRYLLYVLAFYPLVAWKSKYLMISWIITSLVIMLNMTHVYNEFNFPLAQAVATSKTAITVLITANLCSYFLLLYHLYDQVFRKT